MFSMYLILTLVGRYWRWKLTLNRVVSVRVGVSALEVFGKTKPLHIFIDGSDLEVLSVVVVDATKLLFEQVRASSVELDKIAGRLVPSWLSPAVLCISLSKKPNCKEGICKLPGSLSLCVRKGSTHLFHSFRQTLKSVFAVVFNSSHLKPICWQSVVEAGMKHLTATTSSKPLLHISHQRPAL